jgi:adenine-specific DNA-methyltransferase
VIDLPIDLDVFDSAERKQIDRFLTRAKKAGADQSYVAINRKAWWSVGLREPAPILATYMARRPPAFVLNRADARHINIAHGLYPRVPLNDAVLSGLAEYLSSETSVSEGRTYAGGLTKFEPREMERLLVPDIKLLERGLR